MASQDDDHISMLRAVSDIPDFNLLLAELDSEESQSNKVKKAHEAVRIAVTTINALHPAKPVAQPELIKSTARMYGCWQALVEAAISNVEPARFEFISFC